MGLQDAEPEQDESRYENHVIPEGYYWASYDECFFFSKEGGKRIGVRFRIHQNELPDEVTEELEEGETVDVVFFAPAKISMYSNNDDRNVNSSALGEQFENLGLEHVVDASFGANDVLAKGEEKFVVVDEEDELQMEQALGIVFDGKEIKVNVVEVEDEDGDTKNFVEKISEFRDLEPEQAAEKEDVEPSLQTASEVRDQ